MENIIGNRIKELRKESGMTQSQLVAKLREKYGAKTDRTMISKWETGFQVPEFYSVKCLSEIFGVSIDYIMGNVNEPYFYLDNERIKQEINDDIPQHPLPIKNLKPIGKGSYIPLYGRIACGAPIIAIEDLEETVWTPDEVKADFALTCVGDSMINARIADGDTVYIKRQPTVENGEIAAVIVRDEEVTLKRVYYYKENSLLILKPENSAYTDMIFTGEELAHVRILGRAVHFLSLIK